MPAGSRPSVWRGARMRWLLDLTWYGQTYRIADEPTTAPTGTGGATEVYEGGLEIADYDDALELFADSAQPRSVSVTANLDGVVDVVDRQLAGWDLQAATGRLMLFPDGGAARDVVVVLQGVVREPEYGAKQEPVTFTLAEEEEEANGLIPDLDAAYTEETWSSAAGDTEKWGEFYPIIFGRPGGEGAAEGSHALMPNTGRLIIAGHPVKATNVTIVDEENGTSESRPVTTFADGLDRRIATVTGFATIGSPAGTLVAGDPYWVKWDTGGGVYGASEIRGAGDVLRWMLERSGGRWDASRTGAAAIALNSFLIDAAVVASPEERVRPLDWIREHLFKILPVSIRVGPDGLYPVVWRWASTVRDAEATVDVDGSRAVRDGPITYSSRDDIKNEIVLRYRRNAKTERYALQAGVTGDPVLADTDSDFRVHLWARHSMLRYGRRAQDASTDVVADTGTAHAILTWWARRYALPQRLGTWLVDRDLGFLEPGSVVEVLDDEVGLSHAGLVESVVWRTAGDLALRVRVLDAPERDLSR